MPAGGRRYTLSDAGVGRSREVAMELRATSRLRILGRAISSAGPAVALLWADIRYERGTDFVVGCPCFIVS